MIVLFADGGFLSDLAALIVALTGLLTAIFAVCKWFAERRKRKLAERQKTEEHEERLTAERRRAEEHQRRLEAEEREIDLEEEVAGLEDEMQAKDPKQPGQRYWVIAPFTNDRPELWQQVWQFCLRNNRISVGWSELGDISGLDRVRLRAAIDETYRGRKPRHRAGICRMLCNFYHIQKGDVVVARRGRSVMAAIGTVTRTAYYDPAGNPLAVWAGNLPPFPNHIDVRWHELPRDREFPRPVFAILTIYPIDEAFFRELMNSQAGPA